MGKPSVARASAVAAGLWLALSSPASSAPPPAASTAPADRQAQAPPAYTMTAPVTRMVMIRLRNGTDVLEGLNQGIAEQKIKNAVIVGGFGSLIRYHVHVVSTQELPTRDVFMKVDRPQDVLNVSGYVIDGLGYEGWVGCEYDPRAGTVEGLSWARPYGIRGARP